MNQLPQVFHPGLNRLCIAHAGFENKALEVQMIESIWTLLLQASTIQQFNLPEANRFEDLKHLSYRTSLSTTLAHLTLYEFSRSREMKMLARALRFNQVLTHLRIWFGQTTFSLIHMNCLLDIAQARALRMFRTTQCGELKDYTLLIQRSHPFPQKLAFTFVSPFDSDRDSARQFLSICLRKQDLVLTRFGVAKAWALFPNVFLMEELKYLEKVSHLKFTSSKESR